MIRRFGKHLTQLVDRGIDWALFGVLGVLMSAVCSIMAIALVPYHVARHVLRFYIREKMENYEQRLALLYQERDRQACAILTRKINHTYRSAYRFMGICLLIGLGREVFSSLSGRIPFNLRRWQQAV